MIRSRAILIFLALAAFGLRGEAKEWLLEVKDGRLSAPFPSQLAPGDVVKISPASSAVRGELKLENLKGTAEQPIVIDCGGSTFVGTEPLRPDEWEPAGDGLFKSDKFVRRVKLSDTTLQRFFLVFDDKVERMGRVSKGKLPPLPQPESLQPGQWTYDEGSKALYLRLASGKTLENSGVEIPERQSGVAISGMNSAFLEIRNLRVKRFYNDGFNIHGKCEGVKFSDIEALECGDDGLSAHDDCSVEASGFRAEGNATGFCNVNRSRFTASGVTLVRNLAYEVYVTDASQNTVSDLAIDTDIARVIVARGSKKDEGVSALTISRGRITGSSSASAIAIEKDSIFTASDLTTQDCSWTVSGSADVSASRLGGGASSFLRINAGATWKAATNAYSFGRIEFLGQSFAPDSFAAYQQASGQDATSTWQGPAAK